MDRDEIPITRYEIGSASYSSAAACLYTAPRKNRVRVHGTAFKLGEERNRH